MEVTPELQAQFQQWCSQGVVDEAKALVVVIPADKEVDFIEATLETVKCLGRVRVRRKAPHSQKGKYLVLCESKEVLNPTTVPSEVDPTDGSGPWPIILVGPVSEETEPGFKEKLDALLREAGKSPEDLQSLYGTPDLPSTPTDPVLRALGEILDRARPPSEQTNYRRLRQFSGNLPVPAGEEAFEPWMEQARLLVEESDCSPKEKRRRVVESLKGPALAIVKAARASDADVSPEQCLEALEQVFGTVETGEDLYFAFRLMRQRDSEKLSDFLRRLDRVLFKVVERGGLLPSNADRARLEQLLRGAVASDLMLVNLRLRERRTAPPTFLQLLREVRSEEEYEASRTKLNPPVHSLQVQSDMEGKKAELQMLKAEIKEIKELCVAMASNTTKPVEERAQPMPVRPAPSLDIRQNDEVVAMRKQLKRLQQKVENKQAQQVEVPVAALPVDVSRHAARLPPRRPPADPAEYFCYRCGEDGHFAGKCKNPENPGQVIQKLIQALKKVRGPYQRPNPPPDTGNVTCHTKRSAVDVDVFASRDIPPGLIGPPSIETVKINGQLCKAVLDSGSQVTIIFDSWYNTYLADVPIHPVAGLDIWGLSDSSYPYRGYIVVEMEFPHKTNDDPTTISVMALVCPSSGGPEQAPVLIGTNAKASLPKRLARLYGEVAGVNVASTQRVVDCVEEVPSGSNTWQRESEDEEVGYVQWTGPGALKLPPGVSYPALCQVEFDRPVEKEILLVDVAPNAPLPGGVLLTPMVVPRYAIDTQKFTVLLQNESLKEVEIADGTIIGYLYPTDVVKSVPKPEPEFTEGFDSSKIDFGDSNIPEEWKERLRHKLLQRADVFSLSEWDVGLAKGVEHSIRLSDDRPFRERSRRLAPADIDDVRRHIQELLAAGIIKESRSPYASPIVIARKKSGKVRMCIDYRTLNSRTIPDQYTTPRIDDALDCLSGSKWFSVLDLRSGYYQIAMREEDKEKTAFICPLGFYQFERMPQGITGAPATFQRLMEKAVGDMNLLQVLVYLDDLIIFGRTLEEHEERLMKVLDRLQEVGLKISLDKCQFCQPKVRYVGHIVSAEGVATDPAKIEAVTTWPQPTDLRGLRSFLGFCGYYRRFVANYSSIVRPLTELTKGYPPTQHGRKPKNLSKGKKTQPDPPYFDEREPFGERWDSTCTQAFQTIIHRLTDAPVLAFADPNKPYILHVDASLSGLGAVLYQEYAEGLRPVAFASRKVSASEKNYPIHQLEFLALKWAVVDKFHDYLYGARFTVRTDNNPLTYVLTTAKLNATGHRWLANLSTYDFDISYRPGKNNIDADLLSRQEFRDVDTGWETIPKSGVLSICNRIKVQSSKVCPRGYVEQLGASPECIPVVYAFPTRVDVSAPSQLSRREIKTAQQNDKVIGPVIEAVQQGKWPQGVEMSDDLRLMKKELAKLVLKDGLLHRQSKRPTGEVSQLVLPAEYRANVLKAMHDELGHLGVERTTDLIRMRFYWPRLAWDIERHIKNCGECVTRKSPCQRAAPLHQIVSSGPMDLVCIDFLSMEPDSRGISNVLVVTDHFTRYAQAFPARDQKAITVAKILVDKYFIHYGLPARIHSDQGRDFESKLIKEMLKVLGIRKSRTSPYHPQGDPQPERFNRTLLAMLATMSQEKRRRWSQHVTYLVHAYNSTKCDATGYSPYYLMFGREARLPVDVCFGTSPDGQDSGHHGRYVARLKEDLAQAFKLANQEATKTHQRNKRMYDKRVGFQTLEPGDRVLLKNLGLKGKHKLQSRWSAIPYVVEGKLPNLPVYRIKPEDGHGVVKTMHRDHLLPIGQLVRLPRSEREPSPVRPVTRARANRDPPIPVSPPVSEQEGFLSDSSSDYDEDLVKAPYEKVHDGERTPGVRVRRDSVVDIPPTEEPPLEVEEDPGDEEVSESEEGSDITPEGAPEVEVVSEEEVGREEIVNDEGGSEVEETPPTLTHASTPIQAPAPAQASTTGKRTIKPVVKLTYDEPGRSRDQPITIIHRGVGVTIQANGSGPDVAHALLKHLFSQPAPSS